MGDEAVDVNLEYFDRATSPLSGVLFQWTTNAVFRDPGASEVHIRWVREFVSALSPFSSGPYINHMDAESEEDTAEIQKAFGVISSGWPLSSSGTIR